jgi:amino acid transporter
MIISLLVLNAGDIGRAQGAPNPLISILEQSIGVRATAAVGIIVVISIYACAVASMATATRLLFSMTRDNMLPWSGFISRVNSRRQTPQVATVFIWMLSAVVVPSFRQLEIITSVGAVAAYLGYSGIMLATLVSRKKTSSQDGFTLGKWRIAIQLLALIWTLIVVASLSIPDTDIPGVSSKHLPAAMTAIVALAGGLLYVFYVRGKILKGRAGPPGTNEQ